MNIYNTPNERVLCQHCGHINTHFESFEIFDREPDAETGVHIFVMDMKVSVDTDMKDNPSGRRSGVILRLSCEICPEISEICLIQHKGDTIINKFRTDEW